MALNYTETRSHLQSLGLIDANANILNLHGIWQEAFRLDVDPYLVDAVMGWPNGTVASGYAVDATATSVPVRQSIVPAPVAPAPRMAFYGDGSDGPIYVQERQAAPIGDPGIYGSDPNNMFTTAHANLPTRHRELLLLLSKWGMTLPGDILTAWPQLQAQGYSLAEIERYLGFAPGFLTNYYATMVAQSQVASPYDNFYANRPASGSASNEPAAVYTRAPAPAPAPIASVLPAVQAPAPAPAASNVQRTTVVPQAATTTPAPPPPVNTTGPRYNPPGGSGGSFWSSQNSGGETVTEYGGPYTATGGGIVPAAQAVAGDKSKLPLLLLALAAYLMT